MATPARRKTTSSGFTLIELLVVIAIISVLGALIMGALGSARTATKVSLTQGRFTQLKAALDRYEHDFDDYPPSEDDAGLKGASSLYECLITEKKGGPYIKLSDFPTCDATGNGDTAFADAWGKPIYYIHHRQYRNQPPNKREYRLISAGANKEFQNGDKDSDDIVNWNKDKPEQ